LKVLGFIGLLILIIACFNFINLATAQATLRAKEVGVRKTLGSRPIDLISQFMSETSLIVVIAVVLGANLATLLSPLLKYVSDVPDELPFLVNPMVLGFLSLITIVVTLLAGLYPAFMLSSYQPVEALKSKVSRESFAGLSLRKGLVVAQFVIAQALIIGALITINQLDYIRTQDLGFSKDLIYTFGFNSDEATLSKQTALKQNLLSIPQVESVSFNSDQPLSGNTWSSNFSYSTRPEDEKFGITIKFTDENYLKTYGLRLIAGKWLEASDTSRYCVVNMTTLKKLGVTNPEEAIGQNIVIGQTRKLPIVGVTEDFHTKSLHREHEPLVMTTRKEFYWEAGVKIRPGNIKGTISEIKKRYDTVLPEQIFSGRFFDESIARFYEDDDRMSATCKGFGFLAILISCLGLFGLATHAANQRIKEIGIRKVLGASTGGIIGLLSKDFLQLVALALMIAAPLAWMAMDEWLNNFEFRIDIQWQVFVIAGLAAIFIAFITVSYQAIRAAISNPIKALKSE
jgi:ABC-type antimicrobial peptide transport system permease subunit